jgi:hypothetical protein
LIGNIALHAVGFRAPDIGIGGEGRVVVDQILDVVAEIGGAELDLVVQQSDCSKPKSYPRLVSGRRSGLPKKPKDGKFSNIWLSVGALNPVPILALSFVPVPQSDRRAPRAM